MTKEGRASGSEPQLYRLLMRLRNGGALVSAAICPAEELKIAQIEDRFVMDSDGFAYVWRPPTTRSQRLRIRP